MAPYELVDLALSAGARIDVQLSVFITVHLAIFGGIIYVDRPLRNNEKIASMLIYAVFAFLNYRIMQNQLDLSQSIYLQIAAMAIDPCCQTNQVMTYMAQQLDSGQFESRYILLVGGHLVMFIMVGLSILFDRLLSRSQKNSPSGETVS